ncbi:MAG TPA: L-aspartate oxidase [Pseudobdellovibrionaceae bacterium]|nr:L-aspartate oxidase [Pseudobdellovibrionaceae bacterium]
MKKDSEYLCDVLIIGSGVAGLATALKLTEELQLKPQTSASIPKVIILSKEKFNMTNSALAQGGIASVSLKEDSFESHIQDTLIAGAGLCNETTVEDYIRQAPERIKDLTNWGVRFDDSIGLEGGHKFRRIFHVEDQTGSAIHQALLKKATESPHISLLENYFAIDLISNKQAHPLDMSPPQCIGAYVLNKTDSTVQIFRSKHTILATGGAGKIYLYTSNWSGATGDGIAMARRSGARISNLEFVQFHPTCLYHKEARNFLITEALRGEGGTLINANKENFMKKYHKDGSLAPRDIVARSIDSEMKKTGAPCVFLDVTHKSKSFFQERFPHIYNKCLELGIDITKEPIPVVPAAHYVCGGILTDQNGQTDIQNLWATGETACTGFHGANRLASNSLLECLTMANNCSSKILNTFMTDTFYPHLPRPWIHPKDSNADEMIVITHMWEEIRNLMWNYVGIMKTNKRLYRAQQRLKILLSEIKENYSNMQIHGDILELRNIAITANLMVESALRRKESRGTHFNVDCPNTDPTPLDTIL